MNRVVKRVLFPPYFFVLAIARKMRLIKQPTIKICISTNKNFAAKTVPDLLSSLRQAGVASHDIYVMEGGHDAFEKISHDVNYYHVNHNSFDLTALITVVQLDLPTDYWFLLHDTCIVGTKFKTLIHNIPHHQPEAIAIKNFPSMNMGAYRADYLRRKKDLLDALANFDNSTTGLKLAKGKAIETEDILFKEADVSKNVKVYNPWLLRADENYRLADGELLDYYTDRIIEYFPQVDVYKFKANFNLTRTDIIEL